MVPKNVHQIHSSRGDFASLCRAVAQTRVALLLGHEQEVKATCMQQLPAGGQLSEGVTARNTLELDQRGVDVRSRRGGGGVGGVGGEGLVVGSEKREEAEGQSEPFPLSLSELIGK